MQIYFLRTGTDTNIRRYEVPFECFFLMSLENNNTGPTI